MSDELPNWLIGPAEGGPRVLDGPAVEENIAVVPSHLLAAAEERLAGIARGESEPWRRRNAEAVALARDYFEGRTVVMEQTAASEDQPKDCGGSGLVTRRARLIDDAGEEGQLETLCPGCTHPDCPNRKEAGEGGESSILLEHEAREWPPERVYIRKGSDYYWLTEDGAADGNDDDSLWAEFAPALTTGEGGDR